MCNSFYAEEGCDSCQQLATFLNPDNCCQFCYLGYFSVFWYPLSLSLCCCLVIVWYLSMLCIASFGDHTGSVTFSSLELALSEQYSLQSAKLFSNSYIVIPILIQSKFSVRSLSEATSSSYNNLHETPFELWLTALFTNMWILKFVFHCHQSS